MNHDVFEMRYRNDLAGLYWIYRFGWLRVQELGRLMRPENRNGHIQVAEYARSWLARGLVLKRTLPGNAGDALLLAEGGVRMLREAGLEGRVRSGKSVGSLVNGKWTPPKTWRHDLRTAGLLALLQADGYEIWADLELRRQARVWKLPDGIVKRGSEISWVETEFSRKPISPRSDSKLGMLAKALNAVSDGVIEPVMGMRATGSLVVYSEQDRDDKGAIDHRKNITRAIQIETNGVTKLTWARVIERGYSVVEYELEADEIRGERMLKVLRGLEQNGWRKNENGVLTAFFGAHAYIEQDGPELYSYYADGGEGRYASTLTEAKQGVAAMIAELPLKKAA